MVAYSKGRVDKRRILLDKNTSLKDLRHHFGDDLKQDYMCDENYYRFAESDLAQPLYKFSNNCSFVGTFIHRDYWNYWAT